MITLAEAKEYLRVDFDDDNMLIENLIKVADSYLKSAIHKNYDSDDERAKMLARIIVQDLYDNHELTDKVSGTVRKLVSDFALQMKIESGVNDE